MTETRTVFSKYGPYACLFFVGLVLSFPCWWAGLPIAHDTGAHVSYQTAFDKEFWHGDLYPRWLGSLNQDTGSPIFYIQYPLPYFTTAVLGWSSTRSLEHVDQVWMLGIIASVCLIASGFTAYLWLREIVGPSAGLFGSLLYMAAPYHLCADLYARAAIGELFALVWMPLCLLSVNRLLRDGNKDLVLFATSFGLLVVSHMFTAVLLFPILAAQVLVLSGQRYRDLTRLCAGLLMSAALSAIYLVPLIRYRSLFNFDVLTGPNWLFSNHFLLINRHVYEASLGLFKRILGPAGKQPRLPEVMILLAAGLILGCWFWALRTFNRPGALSGGEFRKRGSAWIGIVGLLLVLVMFIRPYGHTEFKPMLIGNLAFSALSMYCLALFFSPFALGIGQRRQVWFSIGVAVASLLMMFHASEWLWRLVPPLQTIQFPWRFSAFLSLAVTSILAAAKHAIDLRGLKKLNWVLVGGAACVLMANLMVWGTYEKFVHSSRRSRTAYVGDRLDPMLPVYVLSSDPAWLRSNPVPGFLQAAPDVEVENLERANGNVKLVLHTASPAPVRVRQLFFPNWKGWIDGNQVPLHASEPEGWISFDVPAGSHTLLLRFERGGAELLGLVTTLGSLAAVAFWKLKGLFTV